MQRINQQVSCLVERKCATVGSAAKVMGRHFVNMKEIVKLDWSNQHVTISV
jgi:hypothetical protein